ncbi:hypothetical protein [Archaeoglobus neptunius]|uniref:hypothetical protein n=1 Tax=Archaeoglobus neptunius TaxID=2798580 RepID=UPI001928D6A6|nr:hypothetical protein [Archaeoglobus neptunius]
MSSNYDVSNIRERYKAYKKATKFPRVVTIIGLVVFMSPVIITIGSVMLNIRLPKDITNNFGYPILLGLFLMLIGILWMNKRERLAPPPPLNELLLLRIVDSINNLRRFKEENIQFYKKEALEEALENITRIYNVLKRTLKKLPRESSLTYESSLIPDCTRSLQLLEEFKNNIKNKLIPAINNLNSSSENKLIELTDILTEMADYFNSPTSEKLEKINLDFKKLEATPKIHIDLIKGYFLKHRSIIDIFIYFVIIPLVVGSIVYIVGIYALGLTKEQVFSMSVTASAIVLSALLASTVNELLKK